MSPTIAEYNQAIQRNGGNVFVTLHGLTFIPSRTVPVRIFNYGAGSYAVIFKAKDALNTYAVRCFLSVEYETIDRYREISNYLKNFHASWLTDFSFFENEINVNGSYYPVLKMDWINGKLLNEYVDEILHNNRLLTALQSEMVLLSRSLERNLIGHGDIQCGNVIVQTNTTNRPNIKLIDYDGIYIPTFRGKVNLEKGRTEFQHPQRTTINFNEKIDRFSFWVILCALEALKFDKPLWLELMRGGYNTLDNMLFTRNDFTNFSNSKLVNRLSAINQPSLSFYLDKLHKFCNSSPTLIDAPVLYNPISLRFPLPPMDKKPIQEPVSEEKVDLVEIISDPTGARVSTVDFKRLGVTPMKIERQNYLNKKLLVTYGTEFKHIQIGQNDIIIDVSFQKKKPNPLTPPEPEEEKGTGHYLQIVGIIAVILFIIISVVSLINSDSSPRQQEDSVISKIDTINESQLRNFIVNFNKCIQINNRQQRSIFDDFIDDEIDKLNTFLAPTVKRYYSEYNLSRSEVIDRAKKYKVQFGVISTDSRIRWDTFKIKRLEDGSYVIDYIEDYTLNRTDNTKPSKFVLHKHVEVNKDFQIQGIYEDILERVISN